MQVSRLTLRVADRILVNQLDWRIQPGECWCLIGRNGAGKSTLLRTLAGLHDADAGSIALEGEPLTRWNPLALARERAYLPQNRHDAFGYSVLDAVLTARHPYQDSRYWEGEEDYRHAMAALQALDVAHLARREARSLSGGERQRVALAAALAQDTPLLLLDEPASALDLPHQVGVMKLLAALCRQRRKSVVLVSHDLNLVHDTATHALLLMEDGAWQAGPVRDIMQAPLLSRCLGYPIEAVQHGTRTIYIPAEESHAP